MLYLHSSHSNYGEAAFYQSHDIYTQLFYQIHNQDRGEAHVLLLRRHRGGLPEHQRRRALELNHARSIE